jgi:hypothetical protein
VKITGANWELTSELENSLLVEVKISLIAHRNDSLPGVGGFAELCDALRVAAQQAVQTLVERSTSH